MLSPDTYFPLSNFIHLLNICIMAKGSVFYLCNVIIYLYLFSIFLNGMYSRLVHSSGVSALRTVLGTEDLWNEWIHKRMSFLIIFISCSLCFFSHITLAT